MKQIIQSVALFCLLFAQSVSWAWGRRGHSMVCQTAAYLVADEPKGNFLKDHSFDLGYYCNVPDLVWKAPATYATESPQHYMNIEIFDRLLRGSSVKNPYELDRLSFEKKFPQVPIKAGRAWWRIREFDDLLMADRQKLMTAHLSKDDRFDTQGMWLVHAGTMGHYIGDMSMPLHISENHDGQLTHQNGVHSFFEDMMVNELVHLDGFDLENAVWKEASARWKKEHARLAKLTIFELIHEESMESLRESSTLLEIDRQVGRKDLKKSANAYKKMIVQRIAAGAVFLAEYYRRALGMDFDNNRFYNFSPKPDYIQPPK